MVSTAKSQCMLGTLETVGLRTTAPRAAARAPACAAVRAAVRATVRTAVRAAVRAAARAAVCTTGRATAAPCCPRRGSGARLRLQSRRFAGVPGGAHPRRHRPRCCSWCCPRRRRPHPRSARQPRRRARCRDVFFVKHSVLVRGRALFVVPRQDARGGERVYELSMTRTWSRLTSGSLAGTSIRRLPGCQWLRQPTLEVGRYRGPFQRRWAAMGESRRNSFNR